jgi:hypothetical protein
VFPILKIAMFTLRLKRRAHRPYLFWCHTVWALNNLHINKMVKVIRILIKIIWILIRSIKICSWGNTSLTKDRQQCPRWDLNPQSQQARSHSLPGHVGLSPTVGLFLYVCVRLKTFTEGNCWACEYEGCAWDPDWFCSRLVSGVG